MRSLPATLNPNKQRQENLNSAAGGASGEQVPFVGGGDRRGAVATAELGVNTATRSQRRWASSMEWVTSTTVTPVSRISSISVQVSRRARGGGAATRTVPAPGRRGAPRPSAAGGVLSPV